MAHDTASKKRKASSLFEEPLDGAAADAVEMPGAAAAGAEAVAASDSSPVHEWRGTQQLGTLEAWRRNAKGKADAVEDILDSALEKDPLSQEEFDIAVASMLPAGSFGPYGIPDLTRVRKALDKEYSLHARLCGGYYLFHKACREPVTKIYDTLKDVRDVLKTYAGWSNKTETGTRTMGTEDPDAVSESDYAEMMRGIHIPSPSKAEQELQDFLETSQSIKQWWDTRTPKDKGAVKRFSDFWSNLVEKSTKQESVFFKQDKDKVKPIVETVLQWEREGTNKKTEKMNFPTDTATGKEAVQPILGAMLRSLSQIPDVSSDVTACRSDQRRERYIPPAISRSRRHVDFESTALSPFTPVLLSQEMSLMKEVKNVRRKNQSAKAMHAEVSKQMCGHLAKRTLIAFDVGDVGIDCRSVGVIITPIYVQVISMSLQRMGTADAKVKMERTPLWPLVTEAAFDAFVQDEADKLYLRPQLFPSSASPSADTPKGMQCLWELLHSSDGDLGVSFFGAEKEKKQQAAFVEQKSSYSVSIGSLLGSGSHGIVYGVDGDGNDDHDLVVKASLVGELRYLEREWTALGILARGEKCQYIPVVKKAGSLRYNIRDTHTTVPAMLISPKGVSALQYLSTSTSKSSDLFALWSHVSEALTFAHKKNVYHLDVSPRNIVVAGDRFVLFDWGCAAFNNEPVVGFRGSLAFAHAQVHSKTNKESWMPVEAHDRASLVFTVCALWKGNPVPWPGFTARLDDGAEAIKHRRDHTEESIADLFQAYLGGEHGKKPIPPLFGENVSTGTDHPSNIKTFIRKWIEGA